MRILLVDPPRANIKNVRTSRVKEPDIGLGYLSSNSKKSGYETAVIDAFAESLSFPELEKRIAAFRPQVVGMPVFTFKFREAAAIAGIVKGINPEIKVVVGGAHATALPKRTLEECRDFDFAVIGEGEETMRELAREIGRGSEEYSGVRGLAWRDGDTVVRNAGRAVIRNLDALEFPDWGAFPLETYFPLYSTSRKFLELPLSGARGCRGRCSFCFRLTRGYIRARSTESIISEIERDISDFGAGSIIFMDEAFTADQERTAELCEGMIRARIPERIHWLCETRVDTVEPDMLRSMKAAGCAHVSYGIESGDQKVLDLNRKGTTVERGREVISWAKQAGLQVDVYYIYGLPHDTLETMKKTLSFSLSVDSDFANYFLFVPYPGTVGMKLAREGRANLRLITEDWTKYGIQIGGAVELRDVKREKLELFQLLSYMLFYLRPRKWKSLLKIVSFKALPVYLAHVLLGMLGMKKPR